ncbi:hypothetical protein ACWGDE_10050 [Streptomyces sp. NPDC054956]
MTLRIPLTSTLRTTSFPLQVALLAHRRDKSKDTTAEEIITMRGGFEEPLGDNYFCEVPTTAERHTEDPDGNGGRGGLHRKGAGGLFAGAH